MSDLQAAATFLVIGLVLGFMIGFGCAKEHYNRTAIAAGVAEYNPTNAHFQFKNP